MRTFLLSAVFTTMVSLTALGGPPTVVLVQFHTSERTLTITRGPGQTESVALLSINAKNDVANAEKLQAVFARLYAEGYALQNSAVSGSAVLSLETVTYVFVKP